MLNALLEVENGFLVHCMAGKDRTGFGVAIIQLALGVSETDVMADYLLTNQASELITTIGQRMSTQGMPLSQETLEILALVKKEYLMAALNELETQFGGINGYLEAAGLATADQNDLKGRLVL
jgi:protein tyrosine/serine phosphatase